MKSDQNPDWNALKELELNADFGQVESWIRKIPFTSGPSSRDDSFTYTNRFATNRMVLAALVFVVLVSGFIPIQDVEKVGTVFYWESKLDVESALQEMQLDWIPRGQIVSEKYPEGNFKKYAALLPAKQGEQEIRFHADWNEIEGITGAEVIDLEEPISRSTYAAFFANLPPSLSKSYGMYTEESADFTRFMNLARDQTDSLFTTERYTYGLSGGIESDSLWYRLTPTAATSYVMTARDLQIDKLMRIEDVIRLLEGDAPEEAEAKAVLTPYFDRLSKELGF